MNKFNGHSSHEELPVPHIDGLERFEELYRFAWDLAKKHISHQAGLVSEDFMDEGFAPDKVWQWDTCFMALYCRLAGDLFPGVQSLDNFYASQRADGYISMSHLLANGADSYPLPDVGGRINPPLLSWAEHENYLISGDATRLPKALESLVAYDNWIETNRKRKGDVYWFKEGEGAYWFEDCGSSGMDNSPRTPRSTHDGAETAYIDLSAQQTLSALCLSKLFEAVGDSAKAAEWKATHAARAKSLNSVHWNERHAFYYDRYLDKNFSSCKTAASFWPMIAEAVSEKQVDALVKHLFDPNEFNRPHPVPTLSFDNPNYCDDGRYWLGGVWAPTNFMIVKGLMKQGRRREAASIASKHLEALWRVWRSFKPNTLWECYAPESDRPASAVFGELCRKDFVGWTGLGPIATLLECLMGLEVDYPKRKVFCRPALLQAFSVENLRFGPFRIALKVAARKSLDEKPQVELSAPCEVELVAEGI